MSSKRNQFNITRGALGDAFKELLSIPYTLATESLGHDKWDKPLIIRDSASGKKFSIRLNVDKVNQSVVPIIETESYDGGGSGDAIEIPFPSIEVELCLPFSSDTDALSMVGRFNRLLEEYTVFNTHIAFASNICNHKSYHWQVQKTSSSGGVGVGGVSELTSIRRYSFVEFENLLYGLDDNNALAYDKLYRVFRECTNLPRQMN